MPYPCLLVVLLGLTPHSSDSGRAPCRCSPRLPVLSDRSSDDTWKARMTVRPAPSPCVFCEIAHSESPVDGVYTDELVTGFMALHPQNPGHLLVIPNEHVENVASLPQLSSRLFLIGSRLAQTLRSVLSGDSCTYLLHEGFQGLHAHLHVIPRHEGDAVDLNNRAAEAPGGELERMAAQIKAAYELTWPSCSDR